jgi:hypothetical protein
MRLRSYEILAGIGAGALERYSKAVVNNPADYYALAPLRSVSKRRGIRLRRVHLTAA